MLHMRVTATSSSCKVNKEFFEYIANFDAFTCVIKICYLLKKFTLCTCSDMMKDIALTLQE